jgi:hypothetical protein
MRYFLVACIALTSLFVSITTYRLETKKIVVRNEETVTVKVAHVMEQPIIIPMPFPITFISLEDKIEDFEKTRSWKIFLDAICLTERDAILSWDSKVGKANELGPCQIKEEFHKDSRIPGSYRQVQDLQYARRTMFRYWKRFCPEALKNRNWEILAEVHNGGPTGPSKPSAKIYWLKVKKYMNKLNQEYIL